MNESYIVFAAIGAIILIFLVLIFTSRSRIIRIYSKYLKVSTHIDLSGQQFAMVSLKLLGLQDVRLSLIKGKLTDAYLGGKYKILYMSEDVAYTASLASISIVAHELGHAIQDRNHSALYTVTRMLNKVTRITNKLILPALLVGLIMLLLPEYLTFSYILLGVAGGLFIANALLKLLTIPMEREASGKALKFLKEQKILTPSELNKAQKLLSVASQTYMVALFDDFLIVKYFRYRRRKYAKSRTY